MAVPAAAANNRLDPQIGSWAHPSSPEHLWPRRPSASASRSCCRRRRSSGIGATVRSASSSTTITGSAAKAAGLRQDRRYYDGYQRQEREAPVDYSRAPPPSQKKPEATTSIVVVGDANADWLAYGLEDAFSEKPEIAVVRKHRTDSGLIRYDARRDTEWPQVAREIIAAEKPKFIVMMIGNNDRQTIREKAPPPAKPGAAKANAQPAQPAPSATPAGPPTPPDPEQQLDPAEAAQQANPNMTPEQARQAAYGPWEFHTEKWELAYIKRIDATIAALKSAGVPVIWVGLPSQRGPKASAGFVLSQRALPQPGREGRHRLCRHLGRLRRRGGPLLAARSGLRRPDPAPAHRRRRLLHQVRRAQARPLRRARDPARHRQQAACRSRCRCRSIRARKAPNAKPGGPAQRPAAGPVVPLTVSRVAPEELIGGGRAAARCPPPTQPSRACSPRASRSRRRAGGRTISAGRAARSTSSLPPSNRRRRPSPRRTPARSARRRRTPRPPTLSRSRSSAGRGPVPIPRLSSARTSRSSDSSASYRGSVVDPIRNLSTAWAAWRPSRIAHTTSDWPRRMSPAANTFGMGAAVGDLCRP